MTSRPYLPAAGHDWALPLYDPVVRLMGIEPTRHRLIEQAGIRPGSRVLEIGCGTGTIVALVKRLHPEAEVVGLDPDPKALARAKRKAERASLAIQFDEAFSDAMPYPDGSFDRVLSSLMFHHLSGEVKRKTASEVRRVLRPGGSLHLLDFAHSEHKGGFLVRLFHPDETWRDNREDRVVALMRESGFTQAERVRHDTLVFGHVHVNYYTAAISPLEIGNRVIG